MKHLLSTADLDRAQAIRILDTAEHMAATQEREQKKLPALRGRTVVNMFYEDSTRTRVSFEAAAKRLSADVITFSAKGSSVSKGESLKDTAATLQALGADAVVVRHPAAGAPYRLASCGWVTGPVVNAGDGQHEHPTQALIDAFSLRRRLRPGTDGLDGLHVAIVGDVVHSRVARSNVWLLAALGARVTLVAPPTLLPLGIDAWPCEAGSDLDEVLPDVDAVMMLRIQAERMTGQFFPTAREYTRRYGLDDGRLQRLPEHAVVLHPGPMNRGLEISAAAADSPRSLILDQVRNGVSVRMAVLYLLLTGTATGAPSASEPMTAPGTEPEAGPSTGPSTGPLTDPAAAARRRSGAVTARTGVRA